MAARRGTRIDAINRNLSNTWRKWFGRNNKVQSTTEFATPIPEDDVLTAGISTRALMVGGKRGVRSRQEIYAAWSLMERDPMIARALDLHVTAALGGHETNGNLIFIEKSGSATDKDNAIVQELNDDLAVMFNKIVKSVAFRGLAFGDSYVRLYLKDKQGVIAINDDEMLYPPLVLPYEKGGKTIGYIVSNGDGKSLGRMTTDQVARFELPRTSWTTQNEVTLKAQRANILEDDYDQLPVLPSMVGGSLLDLCEEYFFNFYTALAGVVGQRWVDSIDEAIIGYTLKGGSDEQHKRFKQNLVEMFTASKNLAKQAMTGKPMLERVRHIIPQTEDKQVTLIGDGLGSKRTGSITIDDVMMHARLMSGALGVDLAMLGFSDQLSGGLGDGGFFRVSVQIAEGSRIIRAALTEFFNTIIDTHLRVKHQKAFKDGKRPYTISFYGSLSAYEAEKQTTKANAINGAGLMVQTLAQAKELISDEAAMTLFLTKQMLLDEDEALTYAKAMLKTPPESAPAQEGSL
jgi:hypothetical protein